MDQRRRPLLGDPRREAVVDAVDAGQLARLRLLPLALPAAQLAGDVVLLAAELAEPDRVGVDGVDLGQGVGDAHADRPPIVLVGEDLGLGEAAQDRALDELHHVEGGAGDALVLAEADQRRHRHGGRPAGPRAPGARGPCRGRSRAACRAAAGAAPSAAQPASLDPVGQVREPAGDALEGERRLGGGGVLAANQASTPARVDPLAPGGAVALACSLVAHSGASIFTTGSTLEPIAGQQAEDRLRDRLCRAHRDGRDRRRPLHPAAPGLRGLDRPLLPSRDRRRGSRSPKARARGRPRDRLRRGSAARTSAQPDLRRHPRHRAARRRRADRRPDRGGAALQRPDRLDATAAGGAGRRRRAARRRRPQHPGRGRRPLGDRDPRRRLQRDGRPARASRRASATSSTGSKTSSCSPPRTSCAAR